MADDTHHRISAEGADPLLFAGVNDANLLELQRTLGEHVEIESVFEDESCPAIVDPNQLATAILNLALNARDAMPDGGKLIIETGSVVLDEIDRSLPIAFMLGTEGPGLSSAALARADIHVRIPMAPGVDSLNVAATSALAFRAIADDGLV